MMDRIISQINILTFFIFHRILTRKVICTSQYFFIQVKICLIHSEIVSHQKKGIASVLMNKSDKFMFVPRKDCVLENIMELVDKQMQGAPLIRLIMIAKTVLSALVNSSCAKPMIWFL